MYQNDPQRVLTAEVRLAYAHLTQPYASKKFGGEPKYQVRLMIPKTDTITLSDIQSAIEAAIQDGITRLWNGQRPAKISPCLFDGDGVAETGEAFGEECHGHWILNAKSTQKPQVVGADNINVQLSPSDIYSGMYARVTMRLYVSDYGSKRVCCGLGNVMKTRDGEAFSGQTTAAQDFANIGGAPAAPQYPVANTAFPAVDPLTGRPYGG